METEEKSLKITDEKGFFYKIKSFFKSLFSKKEIIETIEPVIENTEEKVEIKKEDFKEQIKEKAMEELKLLELQKQYRQKKIREDEMTTEQVKALCELYDKQIAELEKNNEMKRQKILEYRKKIQSAV